MSSMEFVKRDIPVVLLSHMKFQLELNNLIQYIMLYTEYNLCCNVDQYMESVLVLLGLFSFSMFLVMRS